MFTQQTLLKEHCGNKSPFINKISHFSIEFTCCFLLNICSGETLMEVCNIVEPLFGWCDCDLCNCEQKNTLFALMLCANTCMLRPVAPTYDQVSRYVCRPAPHLPNIVWSEDGVSRESRKMGHNMYTISGECLSKDNGSYLLFK